MWTCLMSLIGISKTKPSRGGQGADGELGARGYPKGGSRLSTTTIYPRKD